MKAMKFLAAALIVALSITSIGCIAGNQTIIRPSKNYVTQKVTITDIDAVSASSAVDVVYHQISGQPYAEIYAPDNVLPYIKVEQDGNLLEVGIQSPMGGISIQGSCKYEVRVYAPEVTSFTTQSSADITLPEGVKTQKDVELIAQSSGDIEAPSIQCGQITLSSQSSGDIEVNDVTCQEGMISTSSSGDCNVEKLICNGNVEIQSSSSGDCNIKALLCDGDVTASTSSSSDITLSGHCRNAEFSASSAGSIYAKNLKAKDVTASTSSAGVIECWPNGKLDTRVSSAGEIRYKGNPTGITGKIKGVSRL